VDSQKAHDDLQIHHDKIFVCTVTDPTGTLLNVRTLPNSNAKVVWKFENGMTAVVYDRQGSWAFIDGIREYKTGPNSSAGNQAGSGWVYFPYLTNCQLTDG
jgi:hypothetical protein